MLNAECWMFNTRYSILNKSNLQSNQICFVCWYWCWCCCSLLVARRSSLVAWCFSILSTPLALWVVFSPNGLFRTSFSPSLSLPSSSSSSSSFRASVYKVLLKYSFSVNLISTVHKLFSTYATTWYCIWRRKLGRTLKKSQGIYAWEWVFDLMYPGLTVVESSCTTKGIRRTNGRTRFAYP